MCFYISCINQIAHGVIRIINKACAMKGKFCVIVFLNYEFFSNSSFHQVKKWKSKPVACVHAILCIKLYSRFHSLRHCRVTEVNKSVSKSNKAIIVHKKIYIFSKLFILVYYPVYTFLTNSLSGPILKY